MKYDPRSLSGFFAGLALLLCGIGLYGLFSKSVTQRTTEFGIRVALGAPRFRIVLLVLRHVIILMTIGIVAGGVVAALSTRLIRGFLYGVTSNNPFRSHRCGTAPVRHRAVRFVASSTKSSSS